MTKPSTPLRILIVDDEKPARERARRLLGRIDDINIAGEASGGHEALSMIEETEPDVILLDINMPDINGMRMLQALDDPPAVIFSTAYDEYAVDAFDLEAVDYLLKPYSAERLKKALDRVRRLLTPSQEMKMQQGAKKIAAENGLTTELVPVEKIVVVRIEEGVVFIITEAGETLTSDKTLSELEEILPPDNFFRINRQAIVNLEAIETLTPLKEGGCEISLKGNARETVSRRRARHLRARLSL